MAAQVDEAIAAWRKSGKRLPAPCFECGEKATRRYYDKLGWAYFCDAHQQDGDQPLASNEGRIPDDEVTRISEAAIAEEQKNREA